MAKSKTTRTADKSSTTNEGTKRSAGKSTGATKPRSTAKSTAGTRGNGSAASRSTTAGATASRSTAAKTAGDGAAKPTRTRSSAGGTKRGTAKQTASARQNGAADPTHEQIAARAYEVWLHNGCVPGRDEHNWREAEAQLRAERS